MGSDPGESFMSFENFYGREFWRFVFMQQEVAKLAQTAIDYPPMQAGASIRARLLPKRADPWRESA